MVNRNGQSAQWVIPMRGVSSTSMGGWLVARRTCSGPVTKSEPFSLRVMPIASVNFPGPDARASIPRAVGRRRRMVAIPAKGLERANQHASGLALGLGDKIQALVHPVDEIHVRVSRRSEQQACPIGDTAPGVRRAIIDAKVRLHLDNAAGGRAVHQDFAQTVPSHLDRRACIEFALDRLRHG